MCKKDLRRVRRYAIEYHDNIRPGTSELLRQRLGETHELVVRPSPGGYGMMYGTAKDALS